MFLYAKGLIIFYNNVEHLLYKRFYMKVKLIQPRMLKRPMNTDLKIRMSPHLGLLTVANIIRHECEVTIENENIREIDFNDVPDLVGIAVTVDVLPRAMEIAAIYRKKGAKVVAGGIHITTAFDTVPKEAFDSLCIGFAENTWVTVSYVGLRPKEALRYRFRRKYMASNYRRY